MTSLETLLSVAQRHEGELRARFAPLERAHAFTVNVIRLSLTSNAVEVLLGIKFHSQFRTLPYRYQFSPTCVPLEESKFPWRVSVRAWMLDVIHVCKERDRTHKRLAFFKDELLQRRPQKSSPTVG